MSGITLWYAKLSHKARIGLLFGAIGLILLIVISVAYMTLVPEKVQVRTGTITRDPIDGYVWEDNTETLMVNPSEVSNYHVEYIDKLSEEHIKQLQEEQQARADERKRLEKATGVEAVEVVVPTSQLEDLETIQKNMSVMSQEVITGMDFANELDEMRTLLKQFRGQVASMTLPPELEPLRQDGWESIDMAIKACTLTLQYIGTGDDALLQQAMDLTERVAAEWQEIMDRYAEVPTTLQ